VVLDRRVESEAKTGSMPRSGTARGYASDELRQCESRPEGLRKPLQSAKLTIREPGSNHIGEQHFPIQANLAG
jgi:hypothetical protein